MAVEIFILIVALLFLVLSIFLFNGKGAWLIAGYNTASKEEQEKYDQKKICKAAGYVCVVCAVMLCIMAYMGYRVDSGLMNEDAMLPFAWIFIVVISISVIAAITYMNTKAKK
jgi:cytochrome bd-type quinol oxidase subunit 2